MILQNHRRLPVSIFSVKIAALESYKQVTAWKFQLIQKSLIFSSTKEQKIVKTIIACMYRK